MLDINSSIGIVGGGKGGLEITRILTRCNLMRIDFVADINPSAPAILFAREKRIPTYSDMKQALQENRVNYVIETTGSPRVYQMLKDLVGNSMEIISSTTALLFFRIIDTKVCNSIQTRQNISQVLLRVEKSLQDIQKSLEAIDAISLDLDMLAINARIESAHAETFGKGFAVVADEVKNSARSVQELSGDIARINRDLSGITREIESSLDSLEEVAVT